MVVSKREIPIDDGLDNSAKLLMQGYHYIPNQCQRLQTDIFRTRLMGQHVICISGQEAAEVFYDEERFQRHGAAPKRILKSLFGENGVQTLDGTEHEHRKKLFMDLMTPEKIKDLIAIAENQWEIALDSWMGKNQIVLFSEAETIMCRTACQWAGVPLRANELEKRTTDLSALIDAFGAVGPRHWEGRLARKRTDKWIREIIMKVRSGKLSADNDTALYAMTWHEDVDGNLLDNQTAAVELINILRPIVAVARYVTFGALAMHQFPETYSKLRSDEDNYSQMFVQEIRRYYPFGPFLGARVRQSFTWNGHRFKDGTLVLLDVYGTNHDPDLWENPDQFQPDRFKNWKGSPFDFIPQGGGDYHSGHRCAGEWITIELMKISLEFMTKRMNYDVPKQNLNYSMMRMPSIPKSRFVIQNIRKLHA